MPPDCAAEQRYHRLNFRQSSAKLFELDTRPNVGADHGRKPQRATREPPVNHGDRIEHVKAQSFVRSLKAARPLQPALAQSVPDARADPKTLASIVWARRTR
jgi:hypothetical protein